MNAMLYRETTTLAVIHREKYYQISLKNLNIFQIDIKNDIIKICNKM